MQLPAKQFIDLLESQQLLSDDIVQELRRQVRESKTKLSSERLAKLLVENGHLTKFQATKLVAQASGPASEGAEANPGRSTDDEELGLAHEQDSAAQMPTNVATVYMDDEEIETVEELNKDVVEVELIDEVEAVEVSPVGVATPAPKRARGVDLNPRGAAAPLRPIKKRGYKSNPWDSFRILGVGLLVALLLIPGYFLIDYFRRGSADKRIENADSLYEKRSYETAATSYKEFSADFPTHAKASYARVRRALALLRKDAEQAPDPTIGLKTALDVLPPIIGASEPGFADQQSDLAGALVALAQKFNARGDERKETNERRELMGEMEKLMELINNPQYVGANQRAQQAPSLLRIEEDRQRILREINRDDDLSATLVKIDKLLEAKDALGAYGLRRQLISRYPLLETAEPLVQRVVQAAEIQKSLVVNSPLSWSLSKSEESAAAGRSFVMGNRMGKAIPSLAGRVVFVKIKDGVYGLDLETGNILWRKFVGRGFSANPLRLGAESQPDALVSQPEQGKLSRVSGLSGETKWIANVNEPTLPSVVEGEDLFVATYSGSVANLDSVGGQSRWVKKLPQPIEVAPGVAFGSHLYLPAEHSNLYVLDRRDGSCKEVHYLGHRAGSISVPPILLLGQLFVFENITNNSARIRILATDDNGLGLRQAQIAIQVDGNIVVPPQVDRRRLIVQSDLGHILALDIEPTVETQKVTTIASVPKNFYQPQTSWALTADNKIWAADNRFTRFDVQVSGQKLSRAWIKNDGDTFTGPSQKFDDVIVHTRTLRGNQGIRVAAVHADTGEPHWEIDLGVPVTLLSEAAERKFEAINSSAAYFALDTQPLRSTADANPGQGKPAMNFTQPTWISDSTAVMLNKSNSNQLAIYSKTSQQKLRIISANFGSATPACPPTAVGENFVVGLDNGQLVLVNPSNGTLVGAPFQPAMEPGKKATWNKPLYLADSKTLIVASDLLKMVRLSTGEALRPLTEVDLQFPFSGPLIAVGGQVGGVQSSKAGDTFKLFNANDLAEIASIDLAGRLVAGPFALADGSCLLQSNTELLAVSPQGQKLWSRDFPYTQLVAPPTISNSRLLLVTKAGFVLLVDKANGRTLGITDAGQALASAPIVLSSGLLIGSDEGAVLALPIPTAAEVQ